MLTDPARMPGRWLHGQAWRYGEFRDYSVHEECRLEVCRPSFTPMGGQIMNIFG